MSGIAETLVALLLLASGIAAVVAALGLLRLPDFFTRMHAPALVYSFGTWMVTLATIVHFSANSGSLWLSTWPVIVLLAITAPVTTALLARAALFRARAAGEDVPPPA